MAIGEYLGAGSGVTKGLYHLNGNANDSSGNANNGTATNVTWVGGNIGSGAASFNGSSSVISFSGGPSINVGVAFTCVIWFKPGTLPTGGATQSIISNYSLASSQNGGFALQIIDSSGAKFRGTIFSTGKSTSAVVAGSISSGVWYMGALTYDGANIRTYINGVQVGILADTFNYGSGTDSSNLRLGALFLNPSTIQYYSGLSDENFFEPIAWSSKDIQKYYTYAKGRFGIL